MAGQYFVTLDTILSKLVRTKYDFVMILQPDVSFKNDSIVSMLFEVAMVSHKMFC